MTLVCGPPAAGKSAYVSEHARPGDVVVDWDVLYAALSGLPLRQRAPQLNWYTLAARDAVLQKLEHDPEGVHQAWVVLSAPKRAQRDEYRRRFLAEVVVLDVPEDECIRRIEADPERDPESVELVRQWWRDYER